ncbi:MAG: SMC-Scp complex subunit ScpB [Pseudomonadota bacterium]|nr:SMC-Scp complex subunit ScpB [Pseudomonadota bacterium]
MTAETDSINRLEALLLASESGLSIRQIQHLLDEAWTEAQIHMHLADLATRYAETALTIVEGAQGWRVQIRAAYAGVIQQAWPDRPIKLSPALLETLSVIAYHQPVTRGDIEQIRGVAINSQILRTLFDRQWIAERGHRDVAGRPALLVTTRHFLEAFGLPSLAALPALEQTIVPLATESE